MTATTSYSPTGDPYVDGLLGGIKWGVASLTYSFPTDPSLYIGAYGIFPYGAGEQNNNFKAFTAVQQAAVTSILNMYSSVINVTFTEIPETSTQSATLRYAESDVPPTAYTYSPSTTPEGGDMWFSNSTHAYDNPVVGNYAWDTLMHETGHSLGLKHPHEVNGSFGTMPTDRDSVEYTVMSYRSYIGAPTTGYTVGGTSYPQSLMMYDIAALQAIYGANYTSNSSDTIYSWSATTGQEFINGVAQPMPAGNKIFLTIWDGGGNDTYNFSNYTTNLSIDLRPGDWTTVSTTQFANLGWGHNAAGNIANSLLYQGNTASLIENAVGGTGNDTIIGNAADNKLTGGAGNDSLDGVSGTNTAVYSGASTDYQVVSNGDGTWTVTDLRSGSPDGTDTLSNIEFLQFSDGTVALGATTTPTPTVSSISPDTGANSSDDITNATVLTVSGTAEAGSTVKIYDGSSQSGTYLGNTTADTNGNWTFNTGTLAAGMHNFTATATDTNGTSADSSALIVTIDVTAPAAPTVALSNDTGSSGSDHITSDPSLTLTGMETGAKVEYSIDGGSNWSTSAPTRPSWRRVPTPSMCGRPTSPATSRPHRLHLHPRYQRGGADRGADQRQRRSASDHITNVGTLSVSGLESRGDGQLQRRRRHDLHQQLQRRGGPQQRHRAGHRRGRQHQRHRLLLHPRHQHGGAGGGADERQRQQRQRPHHQCGHAERERPGSGATVSYSSTAARPSPAASARWRASTTSSCGPPTWPATPRTRRSASRSTPARRRRWWR